MKTQIITTLLLLGCMASGCGEQFLDMKPSQSQRVPTKISDYQAMMDNTSQLNQFSCHALGVIGADEYSISDARYDAFQTGTAYNYQKRAYTWEAQIYEGGEINTDWSRAYLRVLMANIALDGLKQIKPTATEQEAYNTAKGSALFFRAMAFYSLAQLFAPVYNPASAETDLGIPLRLEADVTIKTGRSNLAQTYGQILSDLNEAATLLQPNPLNMYRPSKAAAYALLCRTYLQMDNYPAALAQATNALVIKNTLNDFNTMNLTPRYTFPSDGASNAELIFYCSLENVTPIGTSNLNISPEIVNSYAANDLRKKAYLFTNTDGRILFKGSFTGGASPFTGLAVDEMLLNRAECYARMGNTATALADVNALAAKRYEKASFVPFTAASAEQALSLVLTERRKELIFRGLRWEDLRRLNKEAATAKTISRTVKGETYQLLPGSKRYAWPIPLDAILAGGYVQNER